MTNPGVAVPCTRHPRRSRCPRSPSGTAFSSNRADPPDAPAAASLMKKGP